MPAMESPWPVRCPVCGEHHLELHEAAVAASVHSSSVRVICNNGHVFAAPPEWTRFLSRYTRLQTLMLKLRLRATRQRADEIVRRAHMLLRKRGA